MLNEGLSEGDEVVLIGMNHKILGYGEIFKMIPSEGTRIHNILVPDSYIHIKVSSVTDSSRVIPLDIPSNELKSLGDSVGSFIAWRKVSIRAYYEKGNTLKEAFIKLYNYYQVGTLDTSTISEDSEVLEDHLKSVKEHSQSNMRYQDSVIRNSLVNQMHASNVIEQKQHFEMAQKLNEMRLNLFKKANDTLHQLIDSISVSNDRIIKVIGLKEEFVKMFKVKSYNELRVKIDLYVDNIEDYTLHVQRENEKILLEDEEDFQMLSREELVVYKKKQ